MGSYFFNHIMLPMRKNIYFYVNPAMKSASEVDFNPFFFFYTRKFYAIHQINFHSLNTHCQNDISHCFTYWSLQMPVVANKNHTITSKYFGLKMCWIYRLKDCQLLLQQLLISQYNNRLLSTSVHLLCAELAKNAFHICCFLVGHAGLHVNML